MNTHRYVVSVWQVTRFVSVVQTAALLAFGENTSKNLISLIPHFYKHFLPPFGSRPMNWPCSYLQYLTAVTRNVPPFLISSTCSQTTDINNARTMSQWLLLYHTNQPCQWLVLLDTSCSILNQLNEIRSDSGRVVIVGLDVRHFEKYWSKTLAEVHPICGVCCPRISYKSWRLDMGERNPVVSR